MFVNFISHHILSLLIFFPILAAVSLFFLPKKYVNQNALKHFTLAVLFIEFLFSLHLFFYYIPPNTPNFQFAFDAFWLPLPGVNYTLGIDGLSLYLVFLTVLMSFIVFLSTYRISPAHLRSFLACFLLLEGTLIGAFVSLDIFLFYVFWEASLIPLYFMIGVWGGKARIYATLKFFVYGVSGSLLMLVAFVYLYCASGRLLTNYSANFVDIYHTAQMLPLSVQSWLFTATTLAFLIKFPIFPFHSWLADTYEQAPMHYTMMSGVVLKLATYGLIRLSLCAFPLVAQKSTPILLTLGVISILYGAFIAWQQTNLRRIMAFSSLSHMGFIFIGLFAFNTIGLQGALYQMVNHAITAAAFFILFQFIETKFNTLNIDELGGLASVYPWFAFFFVVVAMSAVGLPGTGSFLGEWLILLGVFTSAPIFGSLALLGVIFGAIYVLWFTYKVLFGPLNQSAEKSLHTASFSRVATVQLAVLSLAIFVLGFSSQYFFKLSSSTLSQIQATFTNHTSYQAKLTNIANGIIVQIPH